MARPTQLLTRPPIQPIAAVPADFADLGIQNWVANDALAGRAILDADYENSRFAFTGVNYSGETAFNTAAGIVKTGNLRAVGPYVAPAAVEKLSNPNFDTDVTGWSPASTGGTPLLSWDASGALQVDQNGANNGGASQAIAGELGVAYRVQVRLRNVTGSNSLFALLGNSGFTGGSSSTTYNTQTGYGSCESTSQNVLIRSGVNGGVGTYLVDNISAKESAPFPGWARKMLGTTIVATTPAAISGSQVCFEATGAGGGSVDTRNRVYVVWNSSGEVHVIVTFGNATAADFNFGVVAPLTRFRVDLAMKLNCFVAWFNGGDAQLDTVGTFPGPSMFNIGKGFGASETWQGTIQRVTAFGAERQPGNIIRTEGDSYNGGAGGVVLPATLQALLGRGVYNTAVGGSDPDGIISRMADPNNAFLLKQTTVIWDGSQNGYTTASAYADKFATALSYLGHDRFILIPAALPYNMGPYSGSQAEAVANEFRSRWPNNFLDWRDWVANTSGVINQDRMLNYPTDQWHLNQTAMNEMAAGIAAFRAVKGW